MMEKQNVPGQGLAIASMVLGIVSLVAWPIASLGFALIFGVIGLLLGVIARIQGNNGGMCIAGIVLCIIPVALGGYYIIMMLS